ncbi:Protein VTS1 [Zancudomyces culisetae]|uniref:Protein VTS1 n=1 Tax=Zancudomyces culisetae TaxID=1213189 RepID=A0A1R1PKF2_ZANCU|nr:Protein VTS1 [Zancudomyces culisetae]|eukprot:OMH81450.1 Protein VTS1 [Zancudomyces culisetae]
MNIGRVNREPAKYHSYAGTMKRGSREPQNSGTLTINARERPASAIFFAKANHPLPQITQIDELFESLAQYEDMLEEMAVVSLDPVFKEELNAIDQWFSVLTEAERTAALYSLVQHASDLQVKFLITILQQMARMDHSPIQPNDTSPIAGQGGSLYDNTSNEGYANDIVRAGKNGSFYDTREYRSRDNGIDMTRERGGSVEGGTGYGLGYLDVQSRGKNSFSETQNGELYASGWAREVLPEAFGSPGPTQGVSRARDSYNRPEQLSAHNASNGHGYLGTSRWAKSSFNNPGATIGETVGSRRSIFVDRPKSSSDADQNPDWRSKPTATQLPPLNMLGNTVGVGQTHGNGPHTSPIGVGGSGIGQSGLNTHNYLLNRQGYTEKDRRSIRWSTFSDSLDSYMPMSKESTSSISNIRDSSTIGNRLSIVLGSNRDSSSVLPPPPGVSIHTSNSHPTANSIPFPADSSNPPPSSLSHSIPVSHPETSSRGASISSGKSSTTNDIHRTSAAKIDPSSTSSLLASPSTRTTERAFTTDERERFSGSTTTATNNNASSIPLKPTSDNSLPLPANSTNSTGHSVQTLSTTTPSHKQPSQSITDKFSTFTVTSAPNTTNNNGVKASSTTDAANNNTSISAAFNPNSAAISLPNTAKDPSVDFEILNDIPSWMKSLRLHKYTHCFEGMTYLDIIKLDDSQLSKLGVQALGARRKMLKIFDQIKASLSS